MTTDCPSDVALNDIQNEEIQSACSADEQTSKSLKGLLLGFTITIALGLVVTIGYLGRRIVRADPPDATASVPSSTQAPTPAVASPPLPVEFYLQAASLGPKRDASFVRSLETRGFHATVEKPETSDARILIGPFVGRDEMQQAQRKLEAAGILAIETAH